MAKLGFPGILPPIVCLWAYDAINRSGYVLGSRLLAFVCTLRIIALAYGATLNPIGLQSLWLLTNVCVLWQDAESQSKPITLSNLVTLDLYIFFVASKFSPTWQPRSNWSEYNLSLKAWTFFLMKVDADLYLNLSMALSGAAVGGTGGSWAEVITPSKFNLGRAVFWVGFLNFCLRAPYYGPSYHGPSSHGPSSYFWASLLVHPAYTICLMQTIIIQNLPVRLTARHQFVYWQISSPQSTMAPVRSRETDSKIYDTLKDGHIRLLVIDRGTGAMQLSCRFLDVSLDANPLPEFIAVSYSWGTDVDRRSIRVRGQTQVVELEIPHSAHVVLQRERSIWTSRTVWIDSLCINQRDIAEKAGQIPKMRHIYRRASLVRCYLDPQSSTPNLSPFILWELMWTKSRGYRLDWPFETLFNAHRAMIAALLSSVWLRRKWVIQEVAVARRLEFVYGQTRFSWSAFVELLDLLNNPRTRLWLLQDDLHGTERDLRPSEITLRQTARKLREQGLNNALAIKSIRESVRDQGNISLLDLLNLSSSFLTTVKHDRVYAVVGIGPISARKWFSIDYTMDIDSLYYSVALYLVKEAGAPAYLKSAFRKISVIPKDRPSWLTDWGESDAMTVAAQSLVYDDDWRSEFVTFDETERMMTIIAQPVSVILAVTRTFEEKSVVQNASIMRTARTLKQFWEQLCTSEPRKPDDRNVPSEIVATGVLSARGHLLTAFTESLSSLITANEVSLGWSVDDASGRLKQALSWYLDLDGQHEEAPFLWDNNVKHSDRGHDIKLATSLIKIVAQKLHNKRLAYIGKAHFVVVNQATLNDDILCYFGNPGNPILVREIHSSWPPFRFQHLLEQKIRAQFAGPFWPLPNGVASQFERRWPQLHVGLV